MERIDIKIGFKCNNFCQFCVQGEKRYKYENRTLEQISQALTEAKEQGAEGVVFTGGEPTIHPDILAAVKSAHDLGFKNIQIQSNGRMFAYLDFCKKLVLVGANEFSPALHGSRPEIHDELTSSPGAWQQVVRGIKNLKSLGQYVLTNTVINSKNYQDLPNLAQLFINLGVDQFQFAFVHILGTADKNKEWIVPKMSEVMPFVKKGLDVGINAGKVVMTEAIPYCLMQGYEDYIAEKIIPATKIVDAESVIENFSDYRKNKGKTKRPGCQACKFFKICEGPWKEYPEIYGWDEFQPISSQQNDFVELVDYDQGLCKQISDLYDLGKIISVFKYQGHSCNQVHLFEFEKKKVIVKFTNYKAEKILLEQKMLDKFQDINFPKLLSNKMGQPFFEYGGKLVKIYEFIEGKKVNLSDNLELVINFIKNNLNTTRNSNQPDKARIEFYETVKKTALDSKFKKFNELALQKKGIIDSYFENGVELVLYHNLEPIQDKAGQLYILESEHLQENFYPVLFALAKYLVDIIDKSEDNKMLDIDELKNVIIKETGLKIDNHDDFLANMFLVAELINRLASMDNPRYNRSYNFLIDKL